jgi:hypothetical protein
MKKLILFSLFILTPYLSYTQEVMEKPLVKFSPYEQVDGYSFKFDTASNSYFYARYDTIGKVFALIGNRGNSVQYDYISAYSGVFDSKGNYYLIASNNITDTTFTYFLLKNGKEIAVFDEINENWKVKEEKIYFACKENGHSYLAYYDMTDGTLSKGKPYDDIKLVYYEQPISEGEPVGEIGFTKNGEPYYLASLNNQAFLVIGTAEQKHYSDVDEYYVTEDTRGEMTYFAKDKGKFYESRGDVFVIQGSREYGKKCDYLYGPILFDKTNTPVYICADSAGETSPQRVIIGDKEEKTYNGGVYDLRYSSAGKLIYIASEVKDQNYKNFVVYDGKEGKKYNSVMFFSFLPDDLPLYSAVKNNNKAVIVEGSKVIPSGYSDITDVQLMANGDLAYVGAVYGDYKKKIKDKFFVHLGDKILGPFDGMIAEDYVNSRYLLFDPQSNYAFIIFKLKNIENYVSTQQLVTAGYTSREFDGITNPVFYKSKVLWTASTIVNAENYTYKYQIYYDNKPVGREYDYIGDYVFDSKTGKVTFIAMAANEFFSIVIQL